MLVPMAEHKGFGVAFIVELFATLLSGGVLSPNVNDQDLPATPELSSQSFGCINIRAFRELSQFHKDAQEYIEDIKALPVKEGVGSAKYPGEIEYTNKQRSLEHGIILPEALAEQLAETGRSLGIQMAEMAFLTAEEA